MKSKVTNQESYLSESFVKIYNLYAHYMDWYKNSRELTFFHLLMSWCRWKLTRLQTTYSNQSLYFWAKRNFVFAKETLTLNQKDIDTSMNINYKYTTILYILNQWKIVSHKRHQSITHASMLYMTIILITI